MKKLKKGMVFKNYKEVFEYLELSLTRGDTIAKNKKILDSLCKYDKKGNKIIITRVFKEQKEIVDKRRDKLDKDSINAQMAYLLFHTLDCFGSNLCNYTCIGNDIDKTNYTIKQIYYTSISDKTDLWLHYIYDKNEQNQDNDIIEKELKRGYQIFNTAARSYARKYIKSGLNLLQKLGIIKNLREEYICFYNKGKRKNFFIIPQVIDENSDAIFSMQNYNEAFDEACDICDIEKKNFYMISEHERNIIENDVVEHLSKQYDIQIKIIYKSWFFDFEKTEVDGVSALMKVFKNKTVKEIRQIIIEKMYKSIRGHIKTVLKSSTQKQKFRIELMKLDKNLWGELDLIKICKLYESIEVEGCKNILYFISQKFDENDNFIWNKTINQISKV